MKEDALEQLMRTYQQIGNVDKTMDAANEYYRSIPNNVTALALLSYLHRVKAQQGGPNATQDLDSARQFGQRVCRPSRPTKSRRTCRIWTLPKLKDQLAGIFNGSVGLDALTSERLSRCPEVPAGRR